MNKKYILILAIGFSLYLQYKVKAVNDNSSSFFSFASPRSQEEIDADEEFISSTIQFDESMPFSRYFTEPSQTSEPASSSRDFNELARNFEPLFSAKKGSQAIETQFPSKEIEIKFKAIESNLKRLAEEETKIVKIKDHLKRLMILINSLNESPDDLTLTIENIEKDYKKFKEQQSEIHITRNKVKAELIKLMETAEDYRENEGLYLSFVNKLKDVYKKFIQIYEPVNPEDFRIISS